MDRYIAQENLRRFQVLFESTKDPQERDHLRKLIEREQERLIEAIEREQRNKADKE